MKSSATDPFLILDELTTAQLERIDPRTADFLSQYTCPLAEAFNCKIENPSAVVNILSPNEWTDETDVLWQKTNLFIRWWDDRFLEGEPKHERRQRLRAAIDQRLAARRGQP